MLILKHNSPYDFILHGPPVENIPWGEVQFIHVALDLTAGEDVVPHVDIGNHANERLLGVKSPTMGILLLYRL